MLERIKAGSFYILCSDNEFQRDIDLTRMEWNVNDVIQDRPALSRWHERLHVRNQQFCQDQDVVALPCYSLVSVRNKKMLLVSTSVLVQIKLFLSRFFFINTHDSLWLWQESFRTECQT